MKHTRFGERGEAAVEQETAALSLSLKAGCPFFRRSLPGRTVAGCHVNGPVYER